MSTYQVRNSSPRSRSLANGAGPTANDAAVAVSAVLCGVTLSELALRVLLLSHFGKLKIFAINDIGVLLLPFTAFAWWITRRTGPKGWALSAASMAIGYWSIIQFRGLWVWSGTFDAYWMAKSPWIWPVVIGAATGLGLGLRDRQPQPASDRATAIWLGLLLICAVVEMAGSQVFANSIQSAYGPTRSFVIVAILLVLITGRYLARDYV